MGGFVGIPELVLLAVVLLLIFGPKRLPEIGRSVGHGLRELKDSMAGMADGLDGGGGGDEDRDDEPEQPSAYEHDETPAAREHDLI